MKSVKQYLHLDLSTGVLGDSSIPNVVKSLCFSNVLFSIVVCSQVILTWYETYELPHQRLSDFCNSLIIRSYVLPLGRL